jgi:ankyrin repeat protein
MAAAEQGDTNTVKALLDKGANIEAEDVQGRTPFVRAKLAKQTQAMALLSAEGAKTTSNQWPY